MDSARFPAAPSPLPIAHAPVGLDSTRRPTALPPLPLPQPPEQSAIPRAPPPILPAIAPAVVTPQTAQMNLVRVPVTVPLLIAPAIATATPIALVPIVHLLTVPPNPGTSSPLPEAAGHPVLLYWRSWQPILVRTPRR
nr:hypothetical protein IICANGFA_00093 [Gallid alphaherpesvirus 2]WOL21475.1 hypothetical protein MOAAAGMB_00083 [Gallid alphaherpesvirus 2]